MTKQIATIIILSLVAAESCLYAQNTKDNLAKFRKKQLAEMQNFTEEQIDDINRYRDSLNTQYARFLSDTWESFHLVRKERKLIPMPNPPVHDKCDSLPTENTEIPIEGQKPLPQVSPEPSIEDPTPISMPVTPKKMISMYFFGTLVQVSDTSHKSSSRLAGVSEQDVAAYWESLSEMPISAWIADAQRLGHELKLDDWGFFQLINAMFKAYFPNGTENEKVIFQTFMLNQLGYLAKIGRAKSDLFVLLSTSNSLENTPYFSISKQGGTVQYYIINPQHSSISEIQTCAADYGEKDCNRAMNLADISLPNLSSKIETKKLLFDNHTYSIDCNSNIVDYLETFPCVNFSVYASAPINEPTLKCFKSEILPKITDKSQEDAINFLLHWVQSSFLYRTDDEQFGYEKWNFAEETIASDYSDCDDRAILFAQLVRNLLGIKVLLIYYPGLHLATAVHFDKQQVTGDYVTVDNMKYFICDPTYIGADLGMSMPDLRNIPVEIIRLQD